MLINGKSDSVDVVTLPKALNINSITEFHHEPVLMSLIDSIVYSYRSNGQLEFNIDSVLQIDSFIYMYSHVGPIYQKAFVKSHNLDTSILGLKTIRKMHSQPLSFDTIKTDETLQKILYEYNKKGFPFAQLYLDDFVPGTEVSEINISVQKNQLVILDSLVIKGPVKVSTQFMENYLNLKPGDSFDRKAVESLDKRVKALDFATLNQKPEVIFPTENRYKVLINLEPVKASSLYGILGLIPGGDGKLLVTGDAKLNLINGLGAGETISIMWQRIKEQTQNMHFHTMLPYLMGSSMGVSYDFKLYRRDTSFQNTSHRLETSWFIEPAKRLYAFSTFNRSIPVIDTLNGMYPDAKSSSFGLGLEWSTLDYKHNPTKGCYFHVETAGGNRKIKPSDDFSIDPINTTSFLQGSISASCFIPVKPIHIILIKNQSASIHNNPLYRNEVYRIGGFKTMRGFNEEAFFASTYSIQTLEYRFLIEKNSHLLLFTDVGWFEEKTTAFSYNNEFIYGTGAGMSFETKSGIFSFVYGIGNEITKTPDLRTSRIHLGFTSMF